MQRQDVDLRPWIIDAKDIDVSGDVEQLKKATFHANLRIDQFLMDKSRNEVLVVAPKGFGKTLLLKIKRKSLEGLGYNFIPVNALLDKPIGTPSNFQLRDADEMMLDPNYWRSAWNISIILLLTKVFNRKINRLKSEKLFQLFNDSRLTSACDIFDRVISFPRKDCFLAYEDLKSILIPELRSLHSPVAIFIDNIDEYFESAIAIHDTSSISRNIRKDFWYLAQYGLANSARELNSINNHIKICASIRQEVFQVYNKTDPLASQLRGSAISLRYEKEDLIDILKKNISIEQTSNLASPDEEDLYKRLFGRDNVISEHRYTSEEEHIEDLIIRHTLWRPRDIAAIGQSLSSIDPKRRTALNLRETVNITAASIAEFYLAESRPHISTLDEDVLFPMINSNALSDKELTKISLEYDKILNVNRNTPGKENHVFSDLYILGLLGYVKNSRIDGKKLQHFQSPGETSFHLMGNLPESDNYLIHPVLYELISRRNPRFFRNLNKLNIVGKGRLWRTETDITFVLKGDIVKYSEIMNNADLAGKFPADYEDFASRSCESILYYKISEGDSIVMMDKNWKNLVKSAKDIMEKSIYQRQIRFGGDAGIVSFDRNDKMKIVNLRGGTLRKAARLEPIGISGNIIVTDRFF